MDIKKNALKGTTQDHLPIEDITENMVVLKDGSCAYLLEISSVNFDLLSQREQEAMIYAYASLLNSLTFPIQIFIHSALKDISSYLHYLKRWQEKATEAKVKNQIGHYRQFINQVVEKNNVLTKTFYLVIPFSPLELGLEGAKAILPFSFKKKATNSKLPIKKEALMERAKANLEPKKDHLIRALAQLGLRARQLNTGQLVALFYSIYNQEKLSLETLALDGSRGEKPLLATIRSQTEKRKGQSNV